jgi:poly(3-hydroxyalkanoate) synthetase
VEKGSLKLWANYIILTKTTKRKKIAQSGHSAGGVLFAQEASAMSKTLG